MSSSDERSPKRQRRSYSPASPIATGQKNSFVQPPQTPPPSVHMSPSWQSQPLPGLGMQGVNGPGASGVMVPTPPSTAGFQSQVIGKGEGPDSAQQSPEDTQRDDEAVDEVMNDSREEAKEAGGEDVSMTMDEGEEHRRSDHERQGDDGTPPSSLRSNVLYKLSTEPVQISRPQPSQDLLALYDLTRIQASVARKDAAGNKINKLRKSYEGKLKDLSIEGRNKARQNEHELEGLVHPDWSMVLPSGKTMFEEAKSDAWLESREAVDNMVGMLSSALNMRPGHLPKQEHENWKHQLGLDDVAKASTVVSNSTVSANNAFNSALAAPTKTPASNLLSKTAPATAMRNSAPASPKNNLGVSRPDRAGKKRRYDDSSFVGYEGYDDDGYSTGGVDESGRRGSGGTKRQKRKDFSPASANSPPFNAPPSSNSSVGVRSS